MRRDHGSRRARIVGEASPPNSLVRYGQGVGPWGIPTGLSAEFSAGALSAYRELRFLHGCRGVKELSVGACLYRLFCCFNQRTKRKTEDTHIKFEHLQGSIVAMVTPFRQDGSVNFDMLTELLERQIAAGTDGILTLGTTGEYSTMSHEEDAAVVEHTIRVVDGRVPVMVGSGSNCTVTQIEKSRLYQSMGADALLLISPYYNKANAEGMYRHFAETADAVDIPCILYNVPGRTGCSIPVSVVERLARHPNIAGIKEASGDMSYAMKIARCVGPDFALYSGNDDITVPILSIGGSGVISVYANVMPAMCRQIVADWLDGNHARALENHLRYLQLMNDLFLEVNPIPVKAAMNMMGLDVGPMRLPLCEMGEANAATLRRTLEEAGLL